MRQKLRTVTLVVKAGIAGLLGRSSRYLDTMDETENSRQ